jgi:serine/threonine protein kinase
MTPDDLTRTSPPDATRDQSDAALDAGLAAAFAPDADATADRPGRNEVAGAVIGGKYTLVEPVGEGGMGSVWRAKQTVPVKRFVAVKLIKAGMDSKAVLTRFEAERQALALMDHPNIAKVLDGGLHDHRPYFVMELVKGTPITHYCDANKLNPQRRLELFVQVCQAIQHAHQKGVIHRDIKPNNVLVALYDDRPVVKVIDFGVAKATGGALTEHTLDTGFGGVVGTPAYMSPEQATFNNLDIDTRSDVYALGVLLYELLTGSPPFSGAELKKKGLMEILRVVREDEPPRPSTKLSTADALPSISANRGTEPKALTGLLRNELDWVVMKALEKDRARRYETANGFAADVLRYLSGEAVQAHPPSRAYRLKKFVRRNKGQVLAGGLVFLALLLGFAGTSFGLLRADEAKRRESERADGERRAKETAEAEERRAVELREVALNSLRTGTRRAVSEPLRKPDVYKEKELSVFVAAWDELSRLEGDSVAAREIRAEAEEWSARLCRQMRRADEAQRRYERAEGVYRQLADDHPTADRRRRLYDVQFARAELASEETDAAAAERHYLAAAASLGRWAADWPAAGDPRKDQARVYARLGLLFSEAREWVKAEGYYRTAIDLRKALSEEQSENVSTRFNLAGLYSEYGRLVCARGDAEAALPWLDRAIELVRPDAPAMPAGVGYLGGLRAHRAVALERLGRYEDALADWDAAVESAPPPSVAHRAGRAITRIKGGQVAEGVAEADQLTGLNLLRSTVDSADFACVYAVAAGRAESGYDKHSDRAMQFLRRAVAGGYRNTTRLRTDPNLEPLRERDDFKKLLAELEAKYPAAKKEVLPAPRADK